MGKDLEGSESGVVEVLSWHFPERTEENQDVRQDFRDSNRAHPEYRVRIVSAMLTGLALRLHNVLRHRGHRLPAGSHVFSNNAFRFP
jgi:hypothetical protein